MDAILQSTLWLVQTIVHCSIGAVLLALAAVSLVAGGRCLLDHSRRAPAGPGPVLRGGSASAVALGAVAGLGCLLGDFVIGMR